MFGRDTNVAMTYDLDTTLQYIVLSKFIKKNRHKWTIFFTPELIHTLIKLVYSCKASENSDHH